MIEWPRPDRAATIWVISELYYPEETSTGHVMTKIAEGLATRFPVRVLCAQPTYSARGTRAPAHESHHDVDIRRVWSTTWSNQTLPTRLVNLVTVTWSLFVNSLIRLRRNDRALVVTNPPVLPFAVAVACFVRRARCIPLIHDSYPEVLVAAGVSRSGSLAVRVLNGASRLLYRFATRVVVVGRGMQERARAKLPAGHASKVEMIPNWADTELIPALPRDGCSFLEEIGIADKVVVQFAGNISRLNDIENLVQVIELLREETQIHFLFVGRGGRRDWLEAEVRRLRLSNVTVMDWIPRSRSSEMHRGCDLVLIPLVPGMGGVSVPSRLYNSLAAGRAIIAVTESTSELARVVAEEAVGWVVAPGDPAQLARTIKEAAGDRPRLGTMGARAREVAERRFAHAVVIGQWVKLFKDLDGE